jgi:hypothetical protein
MPVSFTLLSPLALLVLLAAVFTINGIRHWKHSHEGKK